jgi:hypothetical protein
MIRQERGFVDKDDMFAGTHEKGMGVAGGEDGSGQADSKGGGKKHEKKHEKKQSNVVVCRGALGLRAVDNG